MTKPDKNREDQQLLFQHPANAEWPSLCVVPIPLGPAPSVVCRLWRMRDVCRTTAGLCEGAWRVRRRVVCRCGVCATFVVPTRAERRSGLAADPAWACSKRTDAAVYGKTSRPAGAVQTVLFNGQPRLLALSRSVASAIMVCRFWLASASLIALRMLKSAGSIGSRR